MNTFHQFEIRPTLKPVQWELVKWDKNKKTCFTIALLHFDAGELQFELVSCGMRLAEYGTTDLLEWLMAWTRYMEIKFRLEDN